MIKFILIYFVIISILTVFITVLDKYSAKKNKRRVPENTLMMLGLLGGAFAEFVTMKIIRHKTRRKKFMLGLPAEILVHIIIIFAILYTQ